MITLADELMRCPCLEASRARGNPEMERKARKLKERQWSVKAIARELDVTQRTVEKWLYYT